MVGVWWVWGVLLDRRRTKPALLNLLPRPPFFVEAFYPSSLYPEFRGAKRSCRGLVTDRRFYSHLPPPLRTPQADLETLKDNLPSKVDFKQAWNKKMTQGRSERGKKNKLTPLLLLLALSGGLSCRSTPIRGLS